MRALQSVAFVGTSSAYTTAGPALILNRIGKGSCETHGKRSRIGSKLVVGLREGLHVFDGDFYNEFSATEKEPTLASNSKEAANAQFKKEQRVQEGAQARAQYETDARAIRKKTARLRSLRLAKEAADVQIEVKKKPVTQSRKSSR